MTTRQANLKMALALSSFVFLLPPVTYWSAFLVSVILIPLTLIHCFSHFKKPLINSIELPEILLAISFLYFFVGGFLVTNFYLAIKEIIILLCSLGLFCLMLDTAKNKIQIEHLVFTLVLISALLSFYVFNTVDIFNYVVYLGPQVESKNPVGLRISFSIIMILAIVFNEKPLKGITKFFVITSVVMALIAVTVLESSRSIVFLAIAFFVWFLAANFKKAKTTIFILFPPVCVAIIYYFDQILRSLSDYPALNLLFYKLEPYFSGINRYGEMEGGGYGRQEFTSQAAQVAMKGITENPLFGLGPDNSRVLFEREVGSLTNSHNNFSEIALSYGLVGVVLWYLFLGSLGYCFLKHRKSRYFPVSVGFFIAILAISVISPIYREPDIYVMFGLLLIFLTRKPIEMKKSISRREGFVV